MTPYQRRRAKVCKTCKHHVSAHRYDPAEQGRMPPAKCSIPDCHCERFVPSLPPSKVDPRDLMPASDYFQKLDTRTWGLKG